MLLNADVGEGLATDKHLYPYLDQASIACGGHTGSQQTMQSAVQACLDNDVRIGAHPSYPDVDNFGRVSIQIEPAILIDSLQQQIRSLATVCDSLNTRLSYIKPHGALYNDIMAQAGLFDLMLDVVKDFSPVSDLMLAAVLPEHYSRNARKANVCIVREVFADRQYMSNGQLVPRSRKDAVFSKVEQICSQVRDLNAGNVKDELGNSIAIQAESICIHGDNPTSVQAVPAIAQLLNKPLLKN